ncbi:hypothetical protein SUGI_1110260 [Cryptomeria japonica]|nr:hypothetical protein SUGI_1110260 [Cryptomeria japonica]
MVPIWNASGRSAEHAVQSLQDKCLIEWTKPLLRFDINLEHIEMHDHVRDLGRHMADELGPPRLWKPHCLRSMKAKGFKQILAETKGGCFHQFKDSSLGRTITFFIGSLENSAETELLTFQQQLQVNTQENFELRNLEILRSPSLQNLPDLIGKFILLEELRIMDSL